MTAINSNRAIRGPVTAVPVVAGKGVRFVEDTQNNRVVAEADETVLWEGSTSGATSATLSESIMNFDTIEISYAGGERIGVTLVAKVKPTSTISTNGLQLTDWYINNTGNFVVCAMGYYSVSANGLTISGTQIKHMWFTVPNMEYKGTGTSGVKLFKIVGVNRIASAS